MTFHFDSVLLQVQVVYLPKEVFLGYWKRPFGTDSGCRSTGTDAAATNPSTPAFESTGDFSGVLSGVLSGAMATRLRRLDGVSKSSTADGLCGVVDMRLTIDVTAWPTPVDKAVVAAVVTTDSTLSKTDVSECSSEVACCVTSSEKIN
jgi:hypothetical protein